LAYTDTHIECQYARAVYSLEDESAGQRVRQRTTRGEAPWRLGIGGEAGVPDDIEVVARHWNPVEAEVDVGATGVSPVQRLPMSRARPARVTRMASFSSDPIGQSATAVRVSAPATGGHSACMPVDG
jgi:hypothetical protein